MPPRKEARATASLFATRYALLPEEELAANDRLDLAGLSRLGRNPLNRFWHTYHAGGRGFESRRSRLGTPSRPDGRAVDRLADGEMALASGALVVRGDDRVHERVRADRVGEDDN
jgi:hypothetical protein